MANELLAALGPVFGPNFIEIAVNDDTGRLFKLNIYPDVNNPLLKANGMQTHYYIQPKEVYLARKEDSPNDYNFAMTVFKGLMTTEDTIGITDSNTSSGEASVGGGICTFSTTFAIPENVIQKVIQKLKQQDYESSRLSTFFLSFFHIEQNDPEPHLGIVDILENNVTIEVPTLSKVGDSKLPFFIDAQGSGKGSIEADSVSAFLITCNQFAAGAIADSIEHGQVPFTVHYNMKQRFYINACDITVIVNVNKVFEQFSGALSAGGFLGIDDISLSYNYQKCVTSGAITTIMTMDGANIPEDLKKMIEQRVDDMQKTALDLVKHEIFDWTPTPDAPATASRGLFSSLFGGASVSLKGNYQKHEVNLTQQFVLNTSIAVNDTVSGTLNDLEPAIKADKDKYLAIVDIGEYFKKLQVAATNNANWHEKLADGTDLADPIQSIQVEVGYLDYDNPLNANQQPNPQYRASGFHYTIGHKDPNQGAELALWTPDNPRDVINISFLKLDKNVPAWDVDQVKIRKTIIFNADDPRVELANGGTTYIKEETTKAHAPVITPSEVGYVFVKFMLDRILPKDNILVTLNCKLGSRSDTLTINRQNQKNIIWEIFSDKYLNETLFHYQVQVEVTGSNFTDEPVQYQSEWITTGLPTGRIKYLNPFKLVLPSPSPEQVTTINNYIKAYQP